MYEIMEKENIVIEDMIYTIRGVQVMLDKDVAKLYQVETKRLNEVIKRNIDRFPKEFCFKLTKEEVYGFLLNSINYAFTSEQIKDKLRAELKQRIDKFYSQIAM